MPRREDWTWNSPRRVVEVAQIRLNRHLSGAVARPASTPRRGALLTLLLAQPLKCQVASADDVREHPLRHPPIGAELLLVLTAVRTGPPADPDPLSRAALAAHQRSVAEAAAHDARPSYARLARLGGPWESLSPRARPSRSSDSTLRLPAGS
jgi:hypothetical protein